MRHRRRLNTQTINKKKYSPDQSPLRKKNRFPFIKFFVYIIIIAGAGYGLYTYGYPMMQEYWTSEPDPIQTREQQSAASNNKTTVTADESSQPETNAEPKIPPLPERKVQIEVLNGCGEQGIAAKFSEILRQNNYDVVNEGNFLKDGNVYFKVDNSKIIDQLNTEKNQQNAEKLARLVGIDKQYIESFKNPSPIADITLVIGKDFNSLDIRN
ncbi:MAG: hypothetical protein GF313_15605 [Caldithrix sp.]|nr:hypothetical protein [Caldithrix sp.]